MTKDGKIVMAHDETFDRLCQNNKDGQTFRLTQSDELPVFKDNMALFHKGQIKTYDRDVKDQNSFSLLEDVFKSVPKDQIIQIEIKD